jgi:hypothetical protein
MVRGLDDADGYPCGGRSIAECCDCETYCSMCLLFHMDEPHTKPNAALVKDEAERRSA